VQGTGDWGVSRASEAEAELRRDEGKMKRNETKDWGGASGAGGVAGVRGLSVERKQSDVD